jgi:hypothetical protein
VGIPEYIVMFWVKIFSHIIMRVHGLVKPNIEPPGLDVGGTCRIEPGCNGEGH